jgi:hypothetical protein
MKKEPRNRMGEFEKKGYANMSREREHHMDGKTHDRHEMYGHREHRARAYGHEGGHHMGLGTMEMGIPPYDSGEPFASSLTSMTNPFSQFQESQEEVMARGARTSAMENDRANQMKFSDNKQYDYWKDSE